MPVPTEPYLVIDDLSGGLNTSTSPLSLLEHQCVTAQNVEWLNAKMPSKRKGTTATNLGSYAATGAIHALIRWVPRGGLRYGQLWALSSDAIFGQLGNTTWNGVTPSPADTPDSGQNIKDLDGASFNNKLFLTWKSGSVNRLHVWDGTTLRRVGFATSAAPTVADTGTPGSAYAAVVRYYKVSYARIASSVIISQGNLSPAVTFTPDGSHTHARVTKPAGISEGETHWQLWASPDNVNFYLLATTVVATTTYDDNTATTAYSAGQLAPDSGDYTAPGAQKFLTVHDNRLFMAGSWVNEADNCRVWWTEVLGSTGAADDERIPTNNYIDIDVDEGGIITGLASSLGDVFVFKNRAMYKLVATGDPTGAYFSVQISDGVGCIRHKTICYGEDENGDSAVYWLSSIGPYRYGTSGMQFLGQTIREQWTTCFATGTADLVAHGQYFPDKQQVIWWLPTDATANKLVIVYNVRTGAFWTYTGDLAKTHASAIFSRTLGGGNTMSAEQTFYIGSAIDSTPRIHACDTGNTDNGTTYQALVKTKAYPVGGYGRNGGITEAQLYAKVLANQTLTLTIDRDFGLETRPFDCSLSASDTETRIVRKWEDAVMTSAQTVQLQVGDSAAVNSGVWEIDALAVRYRAEESR